MATLACTLSGQGGSVDCGQDLLVHYAPHLLEDTAGKEVMLDYNN